MSTSAPLKKADEAISSALRSPSLLPFSPESVQKYRRDGFLVVEDVFKPQLFQRYYEALTSARNLRGDRTLPDTENEKLEITPKRPVSDDALKHPLKGRYKQKKLCIRCRTEKQMEQAYQRLKKVRDERDAKRGSPPISDAAPGLSEQEAEERWRKYSESQQFRDDVIAKMNVRQVSKFFRGVAKSWVQLWSDPALRSIVVDELGPVIGRAACELSGVLQTRLYTDQTMLKPKWGNAHAYHCDTPFLNFSDPRAVSATIVLPPHTYGAETGGIVMLPGSQTHMNRITRNATDLTVFHAMPPSWDTGEWIRQYPELHSIIPQFLNIPPGSVLFTNCQVVWGHHPSFSSSECLTHTLFTMPDGAVFNGVPYTWMSRHENGPLRHLHAGDFLRDEALFPVLYSFLDE